MDTIEKLRCALAVTGDGDFRPWSQIVRELKLILQPDVHALSCDAALTLQYMKKHAPGRGGFMYEGARPDYENGSYKAPDLDELLAKGLIEPHPDPAKGWVVKPSL